MISLNKIKLFHALYFIGGILLAFHIWGTLDFVFNLYERWGKYELDVLEQITYLYFILSPIVLAYHVQTGLAARATSECRNIQFKGTAIRVFRLVYLVSIELVVLFFSCIVFWFIWSQGDLRRIFLDTELLLIFTGGLALLTIFLLMFILTIKFR